jgi:ribosomal protein L29
LRPRELRELSDDDLELRLHERRQELFNLRFQAATGRSRTLRASGWPSGRSQGF